MTSQTLRAESPHLDVVNCHLMFISEHLVKVKERQDCKQVARKDEDESVGKKA